MTEPSRDPIWLENVPVQGTDGIRRILYLDAHDAFSRNIINFLEKALPVVVDRIPIGEKVPRFADVAKRYDAIVAGSGAGFPDDKQGLGLMGEIWELNVPVLGIGLGFQSLCKHFGAMIERLPEPEYGVRTRVYHGKYDIFDSIEKDKGEDDDDNGNGRVPHLTATIYQSHRVVLDHPIEQPEVDVEANLFSLGRCEQLRPLAWRLKAGPDFETIVMAARHISKPFWGLQFHPESHGSSEECKEIISSWWSQVQRSNFDRIPIDRPRLRRYMNMEIFDPAVDAKTADKVKTVAEKLIKWSRSTCPKVYYRQIPLGDLTTEGISEKAGVPYSRSVVLKIDAECRAISVPSPGSWILEYSISKDILHAEHLGTKQTFDEQPGDIHEVIRQILNAKQAFGGNEESYFWGGLLGYFSYDSGVKKFGVKPTAVGDGERPIDVCLLWTERSIFIDRKQKIIWIQSLRQEDNDENGWISRMEKLLHPEPPTDGGSDPGLTVPEAIPEDASSTYQFQQMQSEKELAASLLRDLTISPPEPQAFRDRVHQGKQFIQRGDAYQLALTTQATVKLPPCGDPTMKALRSWILFKKAIKTNPGRCRAYMQLGPKAITLSSKVHLIWRREPWLTNGPSELVWKDTMSPEEARDHLKRPVKTMETDLAHNDLRTLCGSGDFNTTQLMQPDYRLPSITTLHWGYSPKLPPVLEKGKIPIKVLELRSGNDHCALPESLPPLQTTGAPKMNASRIVADVEDKLGRGIQGGVVGFYDVGGGGCWSVVDRAAFTFSEGPAGEELWHVGASTQVTTDTTPSRAWNSVSKKVARMLGVFQTFEDNGRSNVEEETGQD